jgi:serine/threonine-protein kinase
MLLHYRLAEKIGEGGMGVVWRATDTTLDREVAIKVLPEAFAGDPQRLGRFQREAKLLASLSHARIASLYGLHQAEGVRFLSMELVPGEDLAQRLSRGPLEPERALRVALQVAEGLEAAHERGIIHRDLKPANIKLTGGGDVKILDFGLAKVLQEPASGDDVDPSRSPTMTVAATHAGIVLGTAAYMSPEQARGREVDRRTDVWAFGCVLYEMLTGRGVFHAATASDCMARILEREPDWEALPAATSPAVRRLLQRCLAKDPRQRLHDVADARIEIEEALAGADETGPEAMLPAGGTRSRIAWGVSGLVLGVALTALAASWWLPAETATHPRPRRLTVSLPRDAPVTPLPQTASVVISPDGTRLVYVGPAGLGDGSARRRRSSPGSRTQLYTRRMDEYEVHPIEGTVGATSPFFSPDGEWVGFVGSNDTRLKKTRLQGGVPVTLCDASDIRGASWGEDGRIYFGSGLEGIRAVSAEGGVPETLTTPGRDSGEKSHRFPHVLPGGRGLLFTRASSTMASYDEAGVAVLDLRTGKYRVLIEGGTDPSYVDTGHILYGRGGSLHAVPFDPESMQVTGPPFGVVDGVITAEGWGSVHYSVSDGGTLAYVPGGPERYRLPVYWLDRDGRVEPISLPPRPYGDAVVSPDGRRLALSDLGGNASVWVYDLERETMTRLTTDWDNWGAIWMREGKQVTFSSNRSGVNGLWRVPADGGGAPELLWTSEVGAAGSWSPGDRSLAFFSFLPDTGSDLWLLSNDDGWKAELLLQTEFDESNPVLSPDGRWLAYTSDTTGRSELYVRRFPITERKWQISAGGAERPLWSPDGRELYYTKQGRLMAVSVTTEPGFAPGREREIPQPEFASVASWDIAPDGSRFVVVGELADDVERTDVSEIRVVVGWLEELRRGSS